VPTVFIPMNASSITIVFGWKTPLNQPNKLF